MTEKRFIQVWLDLDAQNGCWNCKNNLDICKINNIGTVGYIRGISHCALKDWEYDADKRTLKTSLEDIIGIVKTDEPTNSVELKKELYK